jgi:hypothetical protein
MAYYWQRWLLDAFKAEGVKVVPVSGWENRGRPSSSGPFDPDGVTWHHTGTKTSMSNPAPTLQVCIDGRSDLPGPLCQALIGYDGTCHLIAAGRANHAGHNNGFGPFFDGDGNTQSFGWEIDYDGTQPMSEQQKDTAVRMTAAVLKHVRHDVIYVVRHQETSTQGKWDTGGLDGPTIRSMVQKYLDGEEEDIMGDVNITSISENAAQVVSQAIWTRFETAVDIENIQRDMAHLMSCVEAVAAKFEVELPEKS